MSYVLMIQAFLETFYDNTNVDNILMSTDCIIKMIIAFALAKTKMLDVNFLSILALWTLPINSMCSRRQISIQSVKNLIKNTFYIPNSYAEATASVSPKNVTRWSVAIGRDFATWQFSTVVTIVDVYCDLVKIHLWKMRKRDIGTNVRQPTL